jgi:hypothetical protein
MSAYSMTSFQPVVADGLVFDLSHLRPLEFVVPSKKLRREIRVWCRFTTHCFTRKPTAGEAGPVLLDEGRRPRMFCPDRYRLSLALPDAIRLLSAGDRHVHQTAAERNWMHRHQVVVAVDDMPTPYQIFFSVRKAPRAAGSDVEMTVESAYPADPLRLPALRGRMLFAGVLVAVVEKRTPHTQGAGKK